MRWHSKGFTPAPGEERRLTKEKTAWARESLCLKWCVGEMEGVNQRPSHLTTSEGGKRWPSSSMGAVDQGVLWLGGSPVNEFCFGDRERDTYVSAPCGYGVEQAL